MTSLDSETALIGCLLIIPEQCCDTVFAETSESMFIDDGCREIYKVCKAAYFENHGSYDIAVIISKLNHDMKALALKYSQTLPSITNWKLYLQEVKNGYTIREALSKAQRLLDSASFGNPSIEEVQTMAEAVIRPFNGIKEANSATASDAIGIFEKEQERTPEYFKFGIPTLDDYSYVEKGDLIVVGGRPSAGKTAVTLNFMLHLAEKYKCVFFSFETSKQKIIDRMVSSYCGIPLENIKRRKLTEEDKQRWEYKKQDFKSLNFEIVEAAGHTVQWIRNEAVARGAQVVFVDYLTIVKSHGNGRYEMTTNAINELHVMAQSEKIVTIVLAQIKRSQGAMPSVEDLKESGGIEEASDMILLLHNGYEDGYKIIIGKNKEGQVGTIDAVFDAKRQTIRELWDGDESQGVEINGQKLPF